MRQSMSRIGLNEPIIHSFLWKKRYELAIYLRFDLTMICAVVPGKGPQKIGNGSIALAPRPAPDSFAVNFHPLLVRR